MADNRLKNRKTDNRILDYTKPCIVCGKQMILYKGYERKKQCGKSCINKRHSRIYQSSLKSDPVKRKERYTYLTEMHKVYKQVKRERKQDNA